MSRLRRRKHRMAEMNVVPYIDVMLVLLIIFMITSPLLTQGVNVNLPKVNKGTQTLETSQLGSMVIVSIDPLGQLHLQQEDAVISQEILESRVESLVDSIRQKGEKAKVYVRGDANTQYGKIIDVMAMLKANGIEEVSLVTQKQ
ncbi:protein TolR [Beggiatoa leptomitoformis]|uniref:Protein TolR n=1 Tax=Beggiatoa leptomitoformis TaxID=288004 RepID=A0A2N9YIY2_9GAMM|nr:protein TolR [Beggiatoa leptomitoformis]ALG67400.1 protein TolR [Beggiatoa leptomitoformis]AUI70389.1 protein TolR [Beggiatoa leptomitoformis]